MEDQTHEEILVKVAILIDQGYTQTSGKYRRLTRYDTETDPRHWKELDSIILTNGEFLAYREICSKASPNSMFKTSALHDRQIRQSRTPKAKRILELIKSSSDADAVDIILDVLGGSNKF